MESIFADVDLNALLAPPAPTELVTAAVTPPGVDHVTLVALATEAAMDCYEPAQLQEHFSLSEDQYERILVHPTYLKLFEQAKAIWESAKNTKQRLQIKAGLSVEQFLPKLHKRICSEREPLNHVVEAAKIVSRIAGVDAPAAPDTRAASDRFSIVINLGADEKLSLTPELKLLPAIMIDEAKP